MTAGILYPTIWLASRPVILRGVSQQASFEMDMAKRGIPSFLADASVRHPPLDIPGAHFLQRHLGAKDTARTMTLESWVAATDPDPGTDLLLQMDIEGNEYDTLAAIPSALLRRFRVIVVELHFLPSVLTKPGFQRRALRAIEKLENLFQAVHLHPNNVAGTVEVDGTAVPRVVEVTLLRRNRVRNPRPVTVLPHPLDCRHDPDRPPLKLPQRWTTETAAPSVSDFRAS